MIFYNSSFGIRENAEYVRFGHVRFACFISKFLSHGFRGCVPYFLTAPLHILQCCFDTTQGTRENGWTFIL